MVRDALRDYLSLAGGLAEELVTSSRRNRENFTLIARHEVEQTIRRFGVGAAVDVDALTQRIRRLERTVRELQAELARAQQNSNAAQPAKKTAARKAAAKKSTAKKATTRKTAAKKSTKRATTKSAATKRSTKKTTARRTAKAAS